MNLPALLLGTQCVPRTRIKIGWAAGVRVTTTWPARFLTNLKTGMIVYAIRKNRFGRNWLMFRTFATGILGCCLLASPLLAAETQAAETLGPDKAALQKARQQGVDYLRTVQSEDGSWTSPKAVGISALVTVSLLEAGVSPSDPTVAKGIRHILSHQKGDGGIYETNSTHRNYETCIAIMTLNEANSDGAYDETIAKAVTFLQGLQWDQGEGLETSDPAFGGAGYGSHERPDLSNTAFLMEALRSAGGSPSDPAIQNALLFVSRSQNLESEYNNTPFAAKVDDGGFYYTPAAGGSSQAGLTDDGGLRSYGSMTYAGLKSMVYAGLTADDPRVKAATRWLRQHYSVEQNPGMGQQGLYYYYQVFAKAMDAFGVDRFEDAQGTRHDWRKELADRLFAAQQSNGSWVNATPRWYEGNPHLATAYALMALRHCEPKTVSGE